MDRIKKADNDFISILGSNDAETGAK